MRVTLERAEIATNSPHEGSPCLLLEHKPRRRRIKQNSGIRTNRWINEGKQPPVWKKHLPTDKPEPHGYEYYLTTELPIDATEVGVATVPGGLYTVSEVVGIQNLAEGWQKLFAWIEKSGHQPVGVAKGTHGWVNSAFEELLDWQQQKPPSEWVFRLIVQLKE